MACISDERTGVTDLKEHDQAAFFFEEPSPHVHPRRSRPGERLRLIVLAVFLLVGVAVSLLVSDVFQARAATDGYTYFPTASPTDGRMLSIAGDGLQTLGGSTVTVSFSIAATATTFTCGFFDGAANTTWDSGAVLDTLYTVYADPKGDGSGTQLVASWTNTAMAANAWSDFTLSQNANARAASGRYFYYMRAYATNRTQAAYNCFKFRVLGSSYITPLNVFGFMASSYTGITNTQTYDGSWDFSVLVPQGKTSFNLWDGDFDRADDTHDLNTPSTIPTWSTNAAVAEGANPGNPPDDLVTDPNGYRRSPAVRYDVIDPLGNTYANDNPSGNSEWELFRLDTAPFNASVMDYHVDAIPAGVWHVGIQGLDIRNLSAMRFDDPILGVDASGTPVQPIFPYEIGDRVWYDANRNGVQDSGETSISGVVVTLRDGAGSFITSTTTDASGRYILTSLPGTYTVDIDDPSNFAPGGPLAGLTATTARTQQTVISTTNDYARDFGLAKGPALVVSKTRTSVATAQVGDDVAYRVTVQNVGETTATSVVVTDTIGGGLTYVAGSTAATYTGGVSSAPPSVNGSALLWDFGGAAQIAAGASLTLTFKTHVPAGTPWGDYADAVQAGADDASGTPVVADASRWIPADTDPDDMDGAAVHVTVPGLSVTSSLTSTDTTMPIGRVATFTAVVRNTGDARVTTAPAGFLFPQANLGYVGAVPAPSLVASGSLSWFNVGPLDPGQQTTLTVTFTTLAAPPGNTVIATSTVGPTTDVSGYSVPAALSTAAVSVTRPHLTVTKSLSSDDPAIQAGQGATFTVVVKNDGDTAIDHVPLSDAYANANLTFTAAAPIPTPQHATLTTYAVNTSDTAGTWNSAANSLGSPDGVVAASDFTPFDLWQSFSLPTGIVAIDDATLTVTTRARGGWGGTIPAVTGLTQTKRPANDGLSNGTWTLTPAGGTAAAKVSDNLDTSYIQLTTTTGGYRLFTPATPFSVPATATNITLSITYRHEDINNGVSNIRSALQVGGSMQYTADAGVDPTRNTWRTTTYTYTVNPSDGQPWTADEINGTASTNQLQQWGIYSNDSNPNIRCSEVTAMVTYDLPAVANDDTWGIEFSTDAGATWADISPDSDTPEAALTDHVLDIGGVLTAANASGLRVRTVGRVVGTPDNSGTVDWDATRLDLAYEKPQVPAGLVTWDDLGGLAPGQQTTVTVSFVASAPPAGNTAVDTATVGAAVDENGDAVPSAVGTASVAITRPQISLTKTLAPSQDPTVGIGAPVSYQILLSNTGDTTITAASVVDTWSPSYLQWVSSSPGAVVGSGVATLALTSPVPPGKAATFTVNYSAVTTPPGYQTVNRARTVNVTDAWGDPAADRSAAATVGIVDTRVSVTKTRSSSDATIQAGQGVTYSIVVKNTGGSTLTTVPLSEAFDPAWVRYATAIPSPNTTSSGSLAWTNLGSLAPGAQTTVTVSLLASAAPPGNTTVDTATVAGAKAADGVVAASTLSTASVAITRPAIGVTLTNLGGIRVPVNGTVTFRAHITNLGDTTAGSAFVADSWTSGLGFSSSVPATAPAGSTATFTVSALAPGASADVTITLAGIWAGNATNTVSVSGFDVNGDSLGSAVDSAGVVVTLPSGTMAVAKGATYATSTAVSVDSTVSDATQMRWDAGSGYTGWVAYAATQNATLSPGDGSRTVTVQYRDAGGNVLTLSDTIVLDTTKPVTTDNAPSGWTSGTVSVTLSAIETGSPPATTFYRLDGGALTTCTAAVAVSAEGTNTLQYWSTDAAGNVEATKSATVRIDRASAVTSDSAPSTWQKAPVTVTLSAAEGTSGVKATYYKLNGGATATYTAGVLVSSEGVNTLQYWSVTNAGVVETTKTASVRLDLSAPVSADNAPAAWQKSAVLVTLSTIDSTSGVKATYYRLSGGAVTTYTVLVNVSAEGTNTLQYWSVDNAGNVEATKMATVRIDLTAPVTTDNAPAGWVKAPPLVTLSATDGGSGAASTYYKLNGGATTTYTVPVNVSAEGTNTLQYWSVDSAGNVETPKTATVRIDPSAPVTTDNAPAGWQNAATSVTLSASDATSGVKATYYELNGGATTTYTVPVPVSADGTNTLRYWSVDNAGNVEATRSATVRIDRGAPVTTDDAPTTWRASCPVAVSLTASDAAAGVKATYYRLNGGAVTTYTAAVFVSAEGTNTLQYWSVDNAGNVEATKTATVRIDLSAPVTTDNAPSGWQNVATSVTLIANDATSGVKATYYKLNGAATATYTAPVSVSAEGTNTLQYWSVDNAGNTEVTKTATVLIDTLAPSGSFGIDHGAAVTGTRTVTFDSTLTADTTEMRFDAGGGYGAWLPYAPSYPGTIATGDGTKTVTAQFRDAAGNTATMVATIVLDTTLPSTTLSTLPSFADGDNGWYRTQPLLTLQGNEAGTTYYAWSATGPFASYASTLTVPSGVNTIWYYSVDDAGNRETTQAMTFKVDTVPPTTPGGVTASAADSGTIDVSWSACTDALSGLASYRVYIDGTLAGSTGGTSYTASGLTSGRTYSFTVAAVDAAGNVSALSAPVTGTAPAQWLWLEVTVPTVSFDSLQPGIPSTLASATGVVVSGIGAAGYDLQCTGADFASGPETLTVGALSFTTHGWASLPQRSFSTSPVAIDMSSGVRGPWQHDYAFDYTMTMPWTSSPGTYTTTILYTVLPR